MKCNCNWMDSLCIISDHRWYFIVQFLNKKIIIIFSVISIHFFWLHILSRYKPFSEGRWNCSAYISERFASWLQSSDCNFQEKKNVYRLTGIVSYGPCSEIGATRQYRDRKWFFLYVLWVIINRFSWIFFCFLRGMKNHVT